MKHETRWGRWIITASGHNWKHKILEIESGKSISLQYHNERSEMWSIISGLAEITLSHEDDQNVLNTIRPVCSGEVLPIKKLQIHKVTNIGSEKLIISEVQLGKCDEDDIVRLEDITVND